MTAQLGYYKHQTASPTAKLTRAKCTSPVPVYSVTHTVLARGRDAHVYF